MNLMIPGPEQHIFECKNLTMMTTASTAPWYSRIYTPPMVMQILKDISFEARSGQIHGIIGSTGSGKSKLLEALASGAGGDIGGTVTLDKQLLTRKRFSQICSLVDFRTNYPGGLTIRQMLYFQAKFFLSVNSNVLEIETRLMQLMISFDIVGYADEKFERLTESARRRVLVAMELAKDPLLLLLDDPLSKMSPLSSYQLVYALQSYATKNNRIVVVTMRSPRSDVYQMLNTMTILYFGDVAYSGPTKKMPSYFQTSGFPCPINENPASYYLSLLSIDRETPERFAETQEQASILVRFHKERCQSLQNEPPRNGNVTHFSVNNRAALCYSEPPNSAQKAGILFRRSVSLFISDPIECFSAAVVLPVLSLFLSFFSPSLLTGSSTAPFSAMGYWESSLHLIFIFQAISFLPFYERMRTQYYSESQIYPSFFSFFIFIAIFHDGQRSRSARSCGDLIMVNRALSNWLKETPIVLTVHSAVISFFLMFADGWMRPFYTVANSVLLYLSFLNPLRFTNFLFTRDVISRLPIQNCTRDESFKFFDPTQNGLRVKTSGLLCVLLVSRRPSLVYMLFPCFSNLAEDMAAFGMAQVVKNGLRVKKSKRSKKKGGLLCALLVSRRPSHVYVLFPCFSNLAGEGAERRRHARTVK
ncbi:unnamed protein product [Caenorhabditis auriculariae]|uniref:ABC transporter domain-containing protein n=1 Tax=Caenorhabditis auriculariae TaxID=2777116 RepID=A0A8S1H439_9PELO|nr:unnamed protein product [Caenorhabditis auriculariae]